MKLYQQGCLNKPSLFNFHLQDNTAHSSHITHLYSSLYTFSLFFCLNCDMCVCVSGLNQWDDIEKLNFFPKLEEVRLQGIPLLQAYTNAERRSLIIAQ